jgi:hypothetical protein
MKMVEDSGGSGKGNIGVKLRSMSEWSFILSIWAILKTINHSRFNCQQLDGIKLDGM